MSEPTELMPWVDNPDGYRANGFQCPNCGNELYDNMIPPYPSPQIPVVCLNIALPCPFPGGNRYL